MRVTFDDGSRGEGALGRPQRWKVLQLYATGARISAEVDPDRVLLLDINRTNNSMTLEPRATEAASKWSLVWMAWLQDLMLTWSFFV